MSGFGSIMQNIFGAKPTQAPVQQMKTPGNFPQNPEIQVDPNNPTNPQQTNNEPAKEPSPMDKYAELFKVDPKANVKPASMFANIKPEDIAAAAKNNDFTKIITPEMQATLQKGGPEATNVMVQMMNAMSQKSFGDSALATTKIVESALAKQQENFMAALPGIIKSQTVTETLRSSNPLFSNPAVAPMLDMVKNQISVKHPEMSAADQTKMAQDYVLQFAQAASPTKQVPVGQDAKGNQTDWTNFLSGE